MAEINKINIKGVDYDIGGGSEPIVINLQLTRLDTASNAIEKYLTIGTDISQEDFNKLMTLGEHKVLIKYSYTFGSTDGQLFEYGIGYTDLVTQSGTSANAFKFTKFNESWFTDSGVEIDGKITTYYTYIELVATSLDGDDFVACRFIKMSSTL